MTTTSTRTAVAVAATAAIVASALAVVAAPHSAAGLSTATWPGTSAHAQGAADSDQPPSGTHCDTQPVTRVRGTVPDQFQVLSPSDNHTYDLTRLRATGMPFRSTQPLLFGDSLHANRTSARYLCVLGGDVRSDARVRDMPRNLVKGRFQGHTMHIEGKAGHPYVVDGLRVDLGEDGLGLQGDNFVVRNSYVSNARDDCVENDLVSAGLFEDTLFDGCYVGLSSEPASYIRPTLQRESLAPVVLDDVLMRLKPLPDPVTADVPTGVTHNRLWKFALQPPTPYVARNSVFLVEERGVARTHPFPAGFQAENVTLVWLGAGAFPSPVPPGVTVTTDLSVWEQAREAWLVDHGYNPLPDFGSLDRTPATSSGRVDLTWRLGSGATSYRVLRSVSSGGPYELVAEVPGTSRSYSDLGVEDGTRYYYVVVSVNEHGQSPPSNEVVAVPPADIPALPTTPTEFEGHPDSAVFGQSGTAEGRVVLAWNHIAGAEDYLLRRGTQPGVYTGQVPIRQNTFIDLGRPVGAPTYYQLVARNRQGESQPTQEIRVDVPAPSGTVLPTPQYRPAHAGDGEISLTWTPDPLAPNSVYMVQRSESPGGPYELVAEVVTNVTYVDDDVENGTTYYYVLQMRDASGLSPVSDEISETPQAAPHPPAVVTKGNARVRGSEVRLRWKPAALAASYTLSRATSPHGPFEPTYSGLRGTTYVDQAVAPHTRYWYRFDAVNSFGWTPGRTVDVRTRRVDHQPPEVTLRRVADGATYLLGDVPHPDYRVHDDSGKVHKEAVLTQPDTDTGAGTYTFRATGEDRAGNATVVYATYDVRYDFDGFAGDLGQPDPVLARSEPVEVDFDLLDDRGDSVSGAAVDVVVDDRPVTPTSSTHDESGYHLELDASSWSTELHTLELQLDDGTVQQVTFRLV